MAFVDPLAAEAAGCPVCGGACTPAPAVQHAATYPFLPGGRDSMIDRSFVRTPHRIVDRDLGRVVYGAGDRVPLDDAVKYGLLTAEEAGKKPDEHAEPTPNRARKRARRKAEDRAHHGPEEDRG